VSREPGADERRIRALLVAREVGPDAIPPRPIGRPRDWLDTIIDTDLAPAEETPEPAAGPEPQPTKAAKEKPAKDWKRKPKKRKRPKPHAARTAWDTRPTSPRQSVIEAWTAVPYRLKWLTYHASSAYLGWSVGLVNWATYVTAWIADTGLIGVQATFWYAAAGATVVLYRRTRRWWLPVAWLAAVPLTSTVAGVLLYGTPSL